MKTILLGTALALALFLGTGTASRAAPGDGLDRNAASTGNSTFAGQHRNARAGSMRSRRMTGSRMMMRRHSRR